MNFYGFLLICAVAVLNTGCMADTPTSFIKRWEDCVNRKDMDCIVKNATDHLIQANGGLETYKQGWQPTFRRHSNMTYDIISIEETADSTAAVKLKQTHYFSDPGWEPYPEDFIYNLKKDQSQKWKLDSVQLLKPPN